MRGWEGMQECWEQPGKLQALSPGCFQKAAGFALKEKERKRVAEKSGMWLNLCRHVSVTMISMSEVNGKHPAFY